MKKSLTFAVLSSALTLACAAPVDLMIGDNDSFGGNLTDLIVGTDYRSAAERVATDGSQQTDLYSALSDPVARSFTLTFAVGAPVEALSFTYRAFGVQSRQYNPIAATANGIDVSSIFFYQDPSDIAIIDYTSVTAFSPAVMRSINASNNYTLTLAVSRATSVDAFAFDYFRLTGTTAGGGELPEPGSLALAGLALLVAGLGRKAGKRNA